MTVQFEKPVLPSSENRKVLRRHFTQTRPPRRRCCMGAYGALYAGRLAIVVEPDEVLGSSGLPIRKTAA